MNYLIGNFCRQREKSKKMKIPILILYYSLFKNMDSFLTYLSFDGVFSKFYSDT